MYTMPYSGVCPTFWHPAHICAVQAVNSRLASECDDGVARLLGGENIYTTPYSGI